MINRTLTIEAAGYEATGTTATLDATGRFRVMEVRPAVVVPGQVRVTCCEPDTRDPVPPSYAEIDVVLRGVVLTGGFTNGSYLLGPDGKPAGYLDQDMPLQSCSTCGECVETYWGSTGVPDWEGKTSTPPYYFAYEGGAGLRVVAGNVTLEGCRVGHNLVQYSRDDDFEGDDSSGITLQVAGLARQDPFGARMCRGGGGVCVLGGRVLMEDTHVHDNAVNWPGESLMAKNFGYCSDPAHNSSFECQFFEWLENGQLLEGKNFLKVCPPHPPMFCPAAAGHHSLPPPLSRRRAHTATAVASF